MAGVPELRVGEEGRRRDSLAAEANLEKHLTFGLYKRVPKTYSILPCYHFQEEKKIIKGMKEELPQEATLMHRTYTQTT